MSIYPKICSRNTYVAFHTGAGMSLVKHPKYVSGVSSGDGGHQASVKQYTKCTSKFKHAGASDVMFETKSSAASSVEPRAENGPTCAKPYQTNSRFCSANSIPAYDAGYSAAYAW